MNNEAYLLSKIITEKSIGYALERGITDEWFSDTEGKNLYRFLHHHYSEYQECPSLEIIQSNFRNYTPLVVEDNIDYFIDKLVESRRKALIINTMIDASQSLETKKPDAHETALIKLQQGFVLLEQTGLGSTTDLEIRKAAKSAMEEYTTRKNNPGLLGLPTGFPTMDASTSGLQPGQLIVIVAPPKTGKSTLALQIAINCHLNGHKPMFMSFEMSNNEQKTRYYAMRARISHKRLMTGTLTDEEEQRYERIVNSIQTMKDDFWFTDSSSGLTVSAVASKIQSKNPDIIFIDGTYLMFDEVSGESNTPIAITQITRNLKRLALNIHKPLVISTQALSWKMKKGQVSADSIGYSSSFHQDADVIFGLQREDENVDDTRLLRVIASRNSGLSEVSLMWDWNTGAFREMDNNDL
jgi:replicative DNA helicase